MMTRGRRIERLKRRLIYLQMQKEQAGQGRRFVLEESIALEWAIEVLEGQLRGDSRFVVVCRGDRLPSGEPGPYSLATRTVFTSEEVASVYASGINSSREPLVVQGDWSGLRSMQATLAQHESVEDSDEEL